MRKLLNTLYVTRPEAYIKKDGLNLVVTVENDEVFRIPVVNIENVVTFGYMGASPGAMQLCMNNNVAFSFHTPSGRFIARLQGPIGGNVLLRRRQYALSEQADFSLALSRIFIAGKIHNYRAILMRALRDHGADMAIEQAAQRLHHCKLKALNADCADNLLGIEGDAAREYFSVLKNMIIQQREVFPFEGRNRRPPRDEINVMLSFVYTMLANDMAAALESVGLDPYVGFMHRLRPGRTSLALDMMEELRAFLGDRLVFSLINRRQITPKDFIRQTSDSMVMTDNGRKTLISAWQERKKQELIHPYIGEKIHVGLLPYVQAMLLARFIRGDINNYPVFIIK